MDEETDTLSELSLSSTVSRIELSLLETEMASQRFPTLPAGSIGMGFSFQLLDSFSVSSTSCDCFS